MLDIHEMVAGKLVALITRRTARDLFDAHRIIAMPGLDWSKIKLATLMIGASARSVDWRQASPEMNGILNEGIIDVGRLDAADEVRAAIDICPALRWKAQNVKAWKTGGASPAKRRGRWRGEPDT